MRKLKLELDTLRVESFTPRGQSAGARGTVRAQLYVTFDPWQACSEPASQYCQETDYHWNTCGESCVNMCFATGVAQGCVD
jgi:hypothetical protein